MDHSSLRPWFLLRAVPGVGDAVLVKLVTHFGSASAVLNAPRTALEEAGCRPPLAAAIRRGPDGDSLRGIERELEQVVRDQVTVLTILDTDYPPQLRAIPDPPPLLYLKGTLSDQDRSAVAIVGTRQVSAAGRVLAEELARDLAGLGLTIVSGLARGVDAAAHRGALAAGGRTIAVMGCGVDRTYPSEHQRLREEIEGQGAVVSELPLGSEPLGHHFPRRNRIISGLSLGVVVTEAAIDSGSLITARLAAEQGREVFAVPGFVKSERSRGPNQLLKDGARLVESAQDVVSELWPQLDDMCRQRLAATKPSVEESAVRFGKEERLVYDALTCVPQTVDAVIQKTGLSAADVAAALLALELKNRIRQLPGSEYQRV